MKAIIIDDIADARKALKQDLLDYCTEVSIIGEADSVLSGAKLIKQLHSDIECIFLDIEMPDGTGFDLLEIIQLEVPVIFCTAHDVYAIKAFKFSAFDYLLKPIDPDELVSCIERLQQSPSFQKKQIEVFQEHQNSHQYNASNRIGLSDEHGIKWVEIQAIIRCQSSSNYTTFHLMDGENITVSKPLKEYDELLVPYSFIRTHQSHLVNPRFVIEYIKHDGGMLKLTNGENIPVSTRKKQEVIQALQLNK